MMFMFHIYGACTEHDFISAAQIHTFSQGERDYGDGVHRRRRRRQQQKQKRRMFVCVCL